MATISANLQAVRQRIAACARGAGRNPESITLIAVSKSWPASAVREAAAAGQRAFGESYVQEALGKMDELADLALVWHFIGPVQSNKTRPLAERFDWVHSVDRLKVAQRLSDARPAARAPLELCVQVNVSGEASKSGIDACGAGALVRQIRALPGLRLRGLMAIPEPTGDPLRQRERFRELRLLRDRMNAEGMAMDTLSMGMSDDLEAAIQEGATMVRIGTAIFGARAR
jgi:hypothetical protein